MNSPLLTLVRCSAEAGILVLILLAVQWLLGQRLTARVRCALWLIMVVRLVPFSLPSVMSIFNLAPAWSESRGAMIASGWRTHSEEVVTPQAEAIASRAKAKPDAAVTVPAATNAAANQATTPRSVPTVSRSPDWSWLSFATVVWLAGAVGLSAQVLWSSQTLARRFRAAQPLTDAKALALWRSCCGRMKVFRVPAVAVSNALASPALHGVFRPRLLLPPGLVEKFSAAELSFVFQHEIAHLKRRDLAVNWVVTLLQVLHWFNPLVWFGLAQWRLEREMACDALALEASGPNQNYAYGRTMLRLLDDLTSHAPVPGLVGMLEDHRQLRQRLQKIADYAPARRSRLAGAALVGLLALVSLTDAEEPRPSSTKVDVPRQTNAVAVPSPPAPAAAIETIRALPAVETPAPAPPSSNVQPTYLTGVRLRGELVVFLVSASGSMLGETLDDAVARLADSDAQKRSAPKWRRTVRSLQELIAKLDPGTRFQVLVYNEDVAPLIPARGAELLDPSDPQVIAEVGHRLDDIVPHGGANLEQAFSAIRYLPRLPGSIVLFTDGLPTRSDSIPVTGSVTPEDRLRFFDLAAKQLPQRIPVSTILFPSNGDPAGPAKYWELANATRGALVSPSASWPSSAPTKPLSAIGFTPDRTHLAFVIDTSGSMRDPNTGGLWSIAIRKIEEVLDSYPHVEGVQLVDGDGRFILGSPNGTATWLPDNRETRDAIKRTLRRYDQDSVSNPVPGIYRIFRSLYNKDDPNMRLGIYVFGDEFNASDSADDVIKRLNDLNPPDGNGHRKVAINAVGFPTTIRFTFSMGNTGLRFANLMRQVCQQHDGVFIALQDL